MCSSVLGGQVVTRLTAAGAKNYTYVPTEGVREVWQEVSTFNAQQVVSSSDRDPLGVLAPGGIAYDPLGHQIVVQNPVAGQPPSGPQYGPSYFGAGGGFTDAYNFSSGCLWNGLPTSCDRVAHYLEDGFGKKDPNSPNYAPGPGGQPWIPIQVTTPRPKPYRDTDSRTITTTIFVPGGQSSTGPQNPTGPWVDPSTVGEAPPLPNPNCIERAVPGGKGKLSGRGLEEAIDATTGKPVHTNLPAHNGQHILITPGTMEPFIALPTMAGTVLHGAHQSSTKAGYPFAMVDILLDTRIDGQQYVMTLTDHYYDGAKLSGRVRPGDLLGNIIGGDNPLSESGMHVTLMPYSVWKEFIGNKRFAKGSRDRVPFNALMGAGTDPRSPFKCP